MREMARVRASLTATVMVVWQKGVKVIKVRGNGDGDSDGCDARAEDKYAGDCESACEYE